jgi:hypothetical protein
MKGLDNVPEVAINFPAFFGTQGGYRTDNIYFIISTTLFWAAGVAAYDDMFRHVCHLQVLFFVTINVSCT